MKLLNFLLCWNPFSWQTKICYQQPTYKNITSLSIIQDKLRLSAPLVFAGECDELKRKLAKASYGKAFLLIGGDCAEAFDDTDVVTIRETFKLLMHMSLILTYGSTLPVIKIGRIAGQYAKPISNPFETINNITLPVYRGDIINDITFNETAREPDPNRLLKAYHLSTQTLNLLRAFASGGYADLNSLDKISLNLDKEHQYNAMQKMIRHCIKFIKAIGINTDSAIFKTVKFYIGHECLLLPYEECLTRIDSISNKWYDCSAHFLWIGERTRQLDSAHVEFIRGINNPVGIKISSNYNETELIKIIK